ncbi:alpha/beta hydrolase [Dyadobacter frigoris]|uniref:Alpha/beta hydrolase n=1 Tax=Dyadobacter frigoris TaxID=2576211 RepID=A0A4U6D261_9BACT|nr:alpha/beta hydrolase-fold protein [Dyadobacter frigoris]TKT90726.1 alpha/beta hydrolase [Dyadobacter frigoris]GLU52057.1 esterase [Dyadobacter frigoris]
MKLLTTILLITISTTPTFAQTNKPTQKDESKPFVLGVIDEIQSTILSEKRILNIYLPDGYSKSDTIKYPVVYLLDGSADEDFIHVSGLFQFNNFSWINRVPKSIIVGIANIDRKRDFTYPTTLQSDKKKYPTAGHSDKFADFLEKELQPFIEKKYKTNSSKMLIGQSLAGLFATEILLKKPTLFSKYIIISPSLWWDNGSLLNQSSAILQDNFSQKTDVYIGVGKEGLTPGDIPRVMEVDANLLTEKLLKTKSKNVTVYFDYLPQEDHGTITHQAIFNALRLLYPVVKKVE